MNSELIERIGIILRIYMGFVEEYFYQKVFFEERLKL